MFIAETLKIMFLFRMCGIYRTKCVMKPWLLWVHSAEVLHQPRLYYLYTTWGSSAMSLSTIPKDDKQEMWQVFTQPYWHLQHQAICWGTPEPWISLQLLNLLTSSAYLYAKFYLICMMLNNQDFFVKWPVQNFDDDYLHIKRFCPLINPSLHA